METEAGPRYSKPFYYNYAAKVYVDQDFTPTKLPNTNLLHLLIFGRVTENFPHVRRLVKIFYSF